MQYEAMIETLQQSCGLGAEEAAHALASVLETLGERLPATECGHLADQLPNEVKQHLAKREHEGRKFGLEDFYTRVAAREGIRYAAAVERARCVAALLHQAVSPGELEDVRASLQAEYGELFGEPPGSAVSPSAV